tara:strand:+ start:469 stop:1071 length:603 start_codon:yes stop_codon:yes gene_type:complete
MIEIILWIVGIFCVIVALAILSDIRHANSFKINKNNYLSYYELQAIVNSNPLYGKQNRLQQYKSQLDPALDLFIKSEGFNIEDIVISQKNFKAFAEQLVKKYELDFYVDGFVFMEIPSLFSVIMNISYSNENPYTEEQITIIKDGINNKDTIKKIISSKNAKKELQDRISKTEDELKLQRLYLQIDHIELLEKIYLPKKR